MAGKVSEIKKEKKEEEVPKLTGEEYWEWMSKIEKMGRKKSELVTAESESKMLQMEYQNKALQIALHNKTRLESAKAAVETALGEYKALKERIEGRLGFKLDAKAIDEVTFEVKDLPKNNN